MNRECVVVLGDLNIDLILKVDFIPTSDIAVAAKSLKIEHGGVGGNLTHALVKLGLNSRVIGGVGRDLFGKELVAKLRMDGVDTSFVRVVSEEPTGMMIILVVPSGCRSIVGFRGANARVWLDEDTVNGVLKDSIHLHLSGYMGLNKDGGEFMLRLARAGREHGVKISIDLEGIAVQRRELVEKLRGMVDYVMLNIDELKSIIPIEGGVESSAEMLLEKINARALFLKMGRMGSLVVDSKGAVKRINAFRVKAVDSTGAGDSFNAGVIYSLLKGYSPVEAAYLGNAMGAYTCTGVGARHVPSSVDELKDMFPELKSLF